MKTWAAIAVAVACGGCGASGHGPTIGASNAPMGGPPGAALFDGGAGGPSVPSPIPGDFRTSMIHVGAARFASRGHAGGRWDADVYANRAGADALGAARGAIPVGALYVEEHFERGDAGAGPMMMMEKRPPGFDAERGDWRYVVVGAHGEVVKDGVVESCAGCHGDAPRDHVFRVE